MTTTLYRVFDANDRLIYVGISDSPFLRFGQHEAVAPWAYHAAKITLTRYSDRGEAATAELEAIRTEDPVFNINGRQFERFVRHMATYPSDDPDALDLDTVLEAAVADIERHRTESRPA